MWPKLGISCVDPGHAGLLERPAEDELHVADRARPEQRLTGGEVEVPDPDEAVVEAERAHLGEVAEEALGLHTIGVKVLDGAVVLNDVSTQVFLVK